MLLQKELDIRPTSCLFAFQISHKIIQTSKKYAPTLWPQKICASQVSPDLVEVSEWRRKAIEPEDFSAPFDASEFWLFEQNRSVGHQLEKKKKKVTKKRNTWYLQWLYVYIYIFIYICLTMSTCCDFLSMNRNKNKQCLAPAVFRCERKHAEEKINERKHQWTMKGDYKLHIRLSTKPLNKKKTRLWNFEFLANKNPAINQKLAKSWHDTGCKTFKNSSKMSRRYCVDEPWHCLKLRSSLVQFLEI